MARFSLAAVAPRRVYVAITGAFVLILAVVNAVLLPRSLEPILEGAPAVDWLQFIEGGRRVFEGNLYETTGSYGFRYSPIVAYAFGALAWMSPLAWRLLHIAAAFALPTWPMRLVTLAAWPFWYDVETGNVMIFVLLAAAWTVRGHPIGTGAFLLLTFWFPRPLMLPILAHILWKQTRWRIPTLLIGATLLAATFASGWAVEWLRLLTTLGAEQGSPNNLGPTRLLGAWWLLVGIPLAGFLTWRGRLGWASLAVSYPYVLPYYLLMLILELPQRLRLFPREQRRAEAGIEG